MMLGRWTQRLSRAGLAALLLAGGAAPAADEARPTYYVQLIRGNDEDKPPAPAAKRIGPKLAKELRATYRWKSYWEINRVQTEIAPGQKARVRLSKERMVEIDLSVPAKRKVTVFRDGAPVVVATQPAGGQWTVLGGDRDPGSVWFVVVRRDKPTEE